MRRSTRISPTFSLLRSASVLLAMAAVVSCTTYDSSSTLTAPPSSSLNPNDAIVIYVPDSVKQAEMAQRALEGHANVSVSANVLAAPSSALSTMVVGAPYSLSRINFAPEAAPTIVLPKIADDGLFPNVPIGFEFNFYGTSYTNLNVYYNGFVSFGPGVAKPFYTGDRIPDPADPNNIIALNWNDWQPQKVANSITYETRGTAPNRIFLLQFTNVPEYMGQGRMTTQLVLSETSNTVTLYTTSMNVTASGSRVTQGIENSDGTKYGADSVTNPITGVRSERIRGWFNLSKDAIRFTPPHPPVITAPADLTVPTSSAIAALANAASPGLCSAIINPGLATATDDAPGVTISGVRSDNLALDAAYPKGVTTIKWTATDADYMTASATQSITVVDKENPLITAPADLLANNDPGLASAVVVTGSASADDNCHEVKISSARSDGAASDAPYMVGLTKITWTAVDGSGNSASAIQSITVHDNEAPHFTAPENFSVNATAPNGAKVSYALQAFDNVAVASIVCTPASGSVLPIGPNPISCTAADAAGNKTTVNFLVSVIDAPTQTMNLIAYIEGLGLDNGVTNPLVNQLLAAFDGGNNSCKKMDDFLSMLRKKGGEIPDANMTIIQGEAGRIMNVMTCPTAAPNRGKPRLLNPGF